jgi:hypothetical protein
MDFQGRVFVEFGQTPKARNPGLFFIGWFILVFSQSLFFFFFFLLVISFSANCVN